jgi:hypothetical protein
MENRQHFAAVAGDGESEQPLDFTALALEEGGSRTNRIIC